MTTTWLYSPAKTKALSITVSVLGAGDATKAGSTSPAAGAVYVYNQNTSHSVTATANSGYSFDHWELDGVSQGSANPISVDMDVDHTLVAFFLQYVLSIAVNPPADGTTSPAAGQVGAVGTQQVTATANAGYVFDHWLLDGVNEGSTNPITVTMTANHTLTAIFAVSTTGGHMDASTPQAPITVPTITATIAIAQNSSISESPSLNTPTVAFA